MTGIKVGECYGGGVLDDIRRNVWIVPLCAWAGMSLYGGAAAWKGQPEASAAVERTGKSDRLLRPFKVELASIPVVSIEFAGRLDATVQDRDGSMLCRVDPANRLTVIANRSQRPPSIPWSRNAATSERPVLASLPNNELPDGCESSFSPYAAPGTTPRTLRFGTDGQHAVGFGAQLTGDRP